MIKAVIFDLDGVIADSEPISGESTRIVLEKHGIRMTGDERRNAFGRRTRDIFRDALSSRNRAGDVGEMVREKDRIFLGMMKGKLKSIPDSVELVRSLKGRGIMVALATSSHEEKMRAELDELGISGLFPVRVNGDEISRGKPDPEIFISAARKLGVEPSECAVVEDSAFGVMAAKSAGMTAIGFLSPNSPGQDLSPADAVIRDISEVSGTVPATGIS